MAGHPVGRPLPGSTELLRAARCALRRRGARGELGRFDRAGALDTEDGGAEDTHRPEHELAHLDVAPPAIDHEELAEDDEHVRLQKAQAGLAEAPHGDEHRVQRRGIVVERCQLAACGLVRNADHGAWFHNLCGDHDGGPHRSSPCALTVRPRISGAARPGTESRPGTRTPDSDRQRDKQTKTFWTDFLRQLGTALLA